MISLDIHLHGEGAPDGDDDHALGEVHADEEGSLAHVHVEAGVHDLYLLAAEHLPQVKVSAKFRGNFNNIQIYGEQHLLHGGEVAAAAVVVRDEAGVPPLAGSRAAAAVRREAGEGAAHRPRVSIVQILCRYCVDIV